MMAQVVKENSTLQVDAKKEWVFLGIMWGVVFLSFGLPSIFKGNPSIVLIPLFTLIVAGKFTWKPFIIIRGNMGERRVFGELKLLPDNYHVLNDVTVKVESDEAQIDHLVLSPYGIWSVETKSHLGRIYGKENDRNWTQKKKSDKGKIYTTTFYNPVAQNAVHCKRIGDFLNKKIGMTIPVRSIVVFTSADQLNIQTNTPVVTPKQLRQTIQTIDRDNKVITDDTIKRIIQAVSQSRMVNLMILL